jgi:hypothetical protein
MSSYEMPDNKRCQVCDARMPDPASWRCGACGAAQTPPPRPSGIRGFLAEVYALRPFVIFAVALIAVVIAMAAAGWGQYFVRGPFWGR